MKCILVVGKGFRGLTDAVSSHGYGYIVLKDRLEPNNPDEKPAHLVQCDFSTRESVLAAVDALPEPIAGVITLYDNYVIPAAWIAAHLQLPGMPIAAAEACTDKQLMRQLFAAAPEKISPDFALVTDEAALRTFAAAHSFPLIVKPANLMKSLLVTKSDSLDELLQNYRRTLNQIDAVYQRYMPRHTPKLLVEEFLQGSIHSVDAFVDAAGKPHLLTQIVDYQPALEAGFDDTFLYGRLLPSRLSAADQQALLHCADLGIRALGMRNTAAHVEIIMTPDGPRLVEIGARQGGYRERMHRLANGIDIPGIALQTALGEQPDISASKNEPCAVIELFPKSSGIFKGIQNEDRLRKLPSFVQLSIKVQPGDRVGKASDGYKMCGALVLHHQDKNQFQKDLAFVSDSVRVVCQ